MARQVFGASIRRVEDSRLIRGAGRYVDDRQPAGCLHAVFLRSHLAHATVRSLNLDGARSAAGIVAAWSAGDLADLRPVEIASPAEDARVPERRVRARHPARHVRWGGPALIAASSRVC